MSKFDYFLVGYIMISYRGTQPVLPLIRLFSASSFFSAGITALLPDVDWTVMSFSYAYPLYPLYDTAKYLISLTGCSPTNIGRSLQWLQEKSCLLSSPALLLVDEVSPMIRQQTAGTNAVVLNGKVSMKQTQDALVLWLNGELVPEKNCLVTPLLNTKEWNILNRYLLVQDMPAVAKWVGLPLKTAYHWRKRALLKLGFNHINQFIRYYPVGSPVDVTMRGECLSKKLLTEYSC